MSIFNYFVGSSFAAYPEKKTGPEFFNRLKELASGYPFYVIETEDKQVVGFGLLLRYHSHETFKRAAEATHFILPGHTRHGLGRRLLDFLIAEAKKMGIDTLLVDISSRNGASISFHRKNGFQECGRFKRVGRKFGKDFDVVWMQRFVNDHLS